MRTLVVLLLFPACAGCATARRGTPTERPTSRAAGLTTDTVERLPLKGEAVRVIMPAAPTAPQRLVRGRFQRLTGDTAVLQREGLLGRGALLDTLPLRGSAELQVLRRTYRHATAGFLIGFLTGAAAGGAIASVTIEENAYPVTKSFGVAVATAGGAVFCGLVGALIGHNIATDEWATVDLDRLGVRPRGPEER